MPVPNPLLREPREGRNEWGQEMEWGQSKIDPIHFNSSSGATVPGAVETAGGSDVRLIEPGAAAVIMAVYSTGVSLMSGFTNGNNHQRGSVEAMQFIEVADSCPRASGCRAACRTMYPWRRRSSLLSDSVLVVQPPRNERSARPQASRCAASARGRIQHTSRADNGALSRGARGGTPRRKRALSPGARGGPLAHRQMGACGRALRVTAGTPRAALQPLEVGGLHLRDRALRGTPRRSLTTHF